MTHRITHGAPTSPAGGTRLPEALRTDRAAFVAADHGVDYGAFDRAARRANRLNVTWTLLVYRGLKAADDVSGRPFLHVGHGWRLKRRTDLRGLHDRTVASIVVPHHALR